MPRPRPRRSVTRSSPSSIQEAAAQRRCSTLLISVVRVRRAPSRSFGGPYFFTVDRRPRHRHQDRPDLRPYLGGRSDSVDEFQGAGQSDNGIPVDESGRSQCRPAGDGGIRRRMDPSQAGLNQVRYSTYFGGGGTQITIIFSSGSIGIGDAIVDLEAVGGKIYVTGATASGDAPAGSRRAVAPARS